MQANGIYTMDNLHLDNHKLDKLFPRISEVYSGRVNENYSGC